jgi:D-xylose transport system permease protein
MKLERALPGLPGKKPDLAAWVMVGVLIAMWTVLSVLPATGGRFLTQGNITNLLTQSAVLLVVSVGMTMVIIVRGIDLSVGATVALTGVVLALCHLRLGLPAPLAIAAAVAVGGALGAWHGMWVAWLGVPGVVVTLAGFKMYRGGALVLSDARGLTLDQHYQFLAASIPVAATWAIVLVALAAGIAITLRDAARRVQLALAPTPPRTIALRLAGQVLLGGALLAIFGGRGMPVLVLIAGAVALWGVFVTQRTRFGRHLYAIGGNPEAARLSGIDVKRTTLLVYVVVGVLAALAGVMQAARLDGVTASNQGHLLELDAVTAVVIGGTSLAGGRGSIVGTVLGTLVFATLANGMNSLRIDSNWQLIFTGLILLAAVLIDVLSKGRRS